MAQDGGGGGWDTNEAGADEEEVEEDHDEGFTPLLPLRNTAALLCSKLAAVDVQLLGEPKAEDDDDDVVAEEVAKKTGEELGGGQGLVIPEGDTLWLLEGPDPDSCELEVETDDIAAVRAVCRVWTLC